MIRKLAVLLVIAGTGGPLFAQSTGDYRAVLDIAGGPLRFGLILTDDSASALCNGNQCSRLPNTSKVGDSIVISIPDFAATITAHPKGDSLIGSYRNVGNRGPRVIPFRASRGKWPSEPVPAPLVGRWDASWVLDGRTSPRVIELRDSTRGLEGTIISNTGDYGIFWGRAEADSFSMSHFDGSYVYMLTGRLDGDTLRGIFHAGLRTQTPFVAVRSTGRPHLRDPLEITQADTAPFRFSFPNLSGQLVTEKDPRFQGKVVLVDIFGTWCPTCHDAAPALVELYRDYHDRGLEIVGLAFEAIGDTAIDVPLVRRYRDKYRIPFPLLIGGVSEQETVAASLPQLDGFTAFPTTIFLGKDGRVRRIHAGFYGPATGAQHEQIMREFRAEVEKLLSE
jgi:thiol-disulfide isomerase/thioredoxin